MESSEDRDGPDKFGLATGRTQPLYHFRREALHADLAVMGIIAEEQDFWSGAHEV